MSLCSYKFINDNENSITNIVRLESNLFAIVKTYKDEKIPRQKWVLSMSEMCVSPYSHILEECNISSDQLSKMQTVGSVESIAQKNISAIDLLKQISERVESIENKIGEDRHTFTAPDEIIIANPSEIDDLCVTAETNSISHRKMTDPIDMDTLEKAHELYMTTNMSMSEIAKTVGIGLSTLYRYKKDDNWEPRPHMKSSNPLKTLADKHKSAATDSQKNPLKRRGGNRSISDEAVETIKTLYTTTNLKAGEIAARAKVSTQTVYSYAHKHNWQRPNKSNHAHNVISNEAVETIKTLYTTTNMSLKDIAAKANVSTATAFNYVRKYGWTRPSANNSDNHEKAENADSANDHIESTGFEYHGDPIDTAVYGNAQIIDHSEDDNNTDDNYHDHKHDSAMHIFFKSHIISKPGSTCLVSFLYDKFIKFSNIKDLDNQKFIDILYSYIKYNKLNYSLKMSGKDINTYVLENAIYSIRPIVADDEVNEKVQSIVKSDIGVEEFLNQHLSKSEKMSVNIAFLYKQFTKHSDQLVKLGEFHNRTIQYSDEHGIERVSTTLKGVQYNDYPDRITYDIDEVDKSLFKGGPIHNNSLINNLKHHSIAIDPDDKLKIDKLYITNSVPVICEMLDNKYSENAIYAYIINNRKVYKLKPWTKEEDDTIIEMLKQADPDETRKHIAQRLSNILDRSSEHIYARMTKICNLGKRGRQSKIPYLTNHIDQIKEDAQKSYISSLARKYRVDNKTMKNFLDSNNIKYLANKQPVYVSSIDLEEVREMAKTMTALEISKILGPGQTTISKYLRDHGITTNRTSSISRIASIDINAFKEKAAHMITSELAKEFNLSITTTRRLLNKYNIRALKGKKGPKRTK